MATLSLAQVTKSFRGGAVGVKDLSLEVSDGELLALVGPSGCGKSTTLSLIAGLERPDAGTIRIGGEVVNDKPPGARDVAMVFQSYALYPHLDVRRNLRFPLEVQGLAHAEIDARFAEAAASLGLTELLSRKPAELSGGQRQRVALGRALVRRPKLFLFDEPLSNLDAGLRAQTRAELKKLHERLGATFVYVTHDQIEAMTLADRVAVLDRGVLQQLGTPREVYDAPKTKFVAGFFGAPAINFAPPSALGVAAPPDRKVEAGVRPEHVTVGLGAAPEGALAGTVFLVEPLGAECWVTVEVNGARLTARTAAGFEGKPGDAAWARVDTSRVHLFDAASGERLP